MAEESIDEVLRKATAERKPLTEQEKKEAMAVAGQVWKTAIEKAKGRDAHLHKEDEESRTYIWINVPKQKPTQDSPDLEILVSRQKFNEKGTTDSPKIESWKFSPGEVTKTDFHSSSNEVAFEAANAIEDPWKREMAIRKYHKRNIERQTQESFDPNGEELEVLHSLISSAQPVVSSVKIVRE